MKTNRISKIVALATLVSGTAYLPAQESPAAEVDQAAELAKKLANPVASLVSVPFQANYDFGIGVNDVERFTLNFQPVIPISINDDWNLIVRTILPIIDAPSPAPGISSASGLGDTLQSFFFSPKEPINGWILAGGPVFSWPTATDSILGSEQWGAGPTFLALKQTGQWTYGALLNHVWSYAGDSSRSEINNSFIQPFLAYITQTKTTFSLNLESSYNWAEEQWNVPVNVMVSQMIKLGSMPAQIFVGGRYYAEAPTGGPEWGIRAGLTLLFPAN
jgi:hypothetical protein